MKNIVILISGRGSNMEAITRACTQAPWPARVAAVIRNQPTASALTFAAQLGIAPALVEHKQYPTREAFDAELARVIDTFQPDLVVLAGFMRILTEGFVQHYSGRLLNIHPSLLPSFGGLDTHARAIEAGCKVAGATVHFVTPALDHGPIVAQAVVPVLPSDTPDTLAERVLALEHQMYPQAIRWFIEGQLAVDAQGRVTQLQGEQQVYFWQA